MQEETSWWVIILFLHSKFRGLTSVVFSIMRPDIKVTNVFA